MNFPEKVKTRSVVVLLACLLIVSSISVYYGLSASTPTSGLTDIYIEPPMMESSYIVGIYTSPSTCYYKNGTTGEIVGTGSFFYCLQNAITALTSGGKVCVRGGDYTLTSQVVIAANNIFVEGEEGMSTSIQWNTTSAAFKFGDGSWHYFCGLKNLIIHGSAISAIDGIYIQGPFSDVWIDNCYISSMNTGITLKCGVTADDKIWNVWIQNCLIEDNLKYGIYLTTTYDGTTRMIDRVKISECHFYGNKNSVHCDTPYVWHVTFTDNTIQAETQSCVNVTSGGRQWIITDNHIFDCGIGANGTYAGIFVNGTGTFYPDSWLIENNIIANHFTSAPVAMNNSIWLTGTVTNFVIQGNFFFQASEPIRIDGLTSYSSIKVNGNNDYAKNLVFPSENRPYSYLIGTFKSSYYMLNCSTGYVDYQGTNFSKVFDFADANMSTLGGGTGFIKAGSYSPDSRMNIRSNNLWEGEGANTIINVYNPPAWDGAVGNIHGQGDNPSIIDYNIVIRNMVFNGSGNSFTSKGYLLELSCAWNTTIEYCTFQNANKSDGSWGLMINGESNVNTGLICAFNHIEHNTFLNISYDAVQIKDLVSPYHTGAQYNTIAFNDITDVQCGVAFVCADNNRAIGNVIYNNTRTTTGDDAVGITLHGSCFSQISDNTVSGSKVLGNEPTFSGEVAKFNTWTNNLFVIGDNTQQALGLGTDTQVIGNTFSFPNGYYASWGILLDGNNYITHNTFNGTSGWSGCIYLAAASLNVSIVDNFFINQNKGIYVANGTSGVLIERNRFKSGDGIFLDVNSFNNTVQVNVFEKTGLMSNSNSTNLIRWNTGWKTEGSASSINATTTTWTFTIANVTALTRCYFSFNATVTDPFWSATGATLTITAGAIIAGNNTACYVEWYCWNYP